MSEDDLLDALDEGFVTSPVASQCPPLKSSEVCSILTDLQDFFVPLTNVHIVRDVSTESDNTKTVKY